MDEESVAFVNSVLDKCRLADPGKGATERQQREKGSNNKDNNA